MGGGRGKLSTVVAAIAVCLLLGACAGGTGADYTLSSKQAALNYFVAQAQAVCTATQAAYEQLPPQPQGTLKPGSARTKAYIRTLQRTASLTKAEIGKLKQVARSPKAAQTPSQRKAFEQYLDSLSASAEVTEQEAALVPSHGVQAIAAVHGSVVQRANELSTYADRSNLGVPCGGTTEAHVFAPGPSKSF